MTAHSAPCKPETDARVKRLCVVYNPRAGMRREKRLRRTVAALERRGCKVRLHRTNGAGDGESIAAALPDCDRVVVAGGDGTIHEVVNGLAARDLPIAVIPLGTANVLAHELGLPRDPEGLARTIVAGPARRVHLGSVNGRRFVQMVGVGFDARVVARVNGALKQRLGKLAFVVAFVQVMLRYGSPRYRIEGNGTAAEAPFIVVSKGRHYGGPFRIAPDAGLDDPRLHACLFKRCGMLPSIRYGLALIANRLPRQAGFEIETGRRFRIHGEDGDPIQADGEPAGHLPAEIVVLPNAARFVVPPDTG